MTPDRAVSGFARFEVETLPFIFSVVQNDRRTLASLPERRAANHGKSRPQKHFLHRLPIVKKLVLIPLTKIQIHDFHWRLFPTTARIDQLLWSIQISSQHEFGVRDDDTKAAARLENAMGFASDPLSVDKRKMLHHMFAKDTVEAFVWERERPAEINEVVHILVTKSVDIYPVRFVDTSRAGAKVQEQRSRALRESSANSRFLPSEYIPHSESKKMKIPARNRQKPVTKKPEQEATQESQLRRSERQLRSRWRG